jgi:hypothetical protein
MPYVMLQGKFIITSHVGETAAVAPLGKSEIGVTSRGSSVIFACLASQVLASSVLYKGFAKQGNFKFVLTT